jgi:hypothetical protein
MWQMGNNQWLVTYQIHNSYHSIVGVDNNSNIPDLWMADTNHNNLHPFPV